MNNRYIRLTRVSVRRLNLRNVHTVAGLLMGLMFLVSGFYLRFRIVSDPGVSVAQHMMYRANHIYLLFACLANLLLIPYFIHHTTHWGNRLKIAGSFLLLLSSVILLFAFIHEPVQNTLKRPLSAWGIIILFASVLLMIINFYWEKFKPTEKNAG